MGFDDYFSAIAYNTGIACLANRFLFDRGIHTHLVHLLGFF